MYITHRTCLSIDTPSRHAVFDHATPICIALYHATSYYAIDVLTAVHRSQDL